MARSDKSGDESSPNYLIYTAAILGTAGLAVSLVRALLPLLQIALPVGIGWWVWRRYQLTQKKQQDTLNTIFYQLLQDHQGRITVLDFAMASRLPAIAAREFLDARAMDFTAHFEVTERGDVVYLFPTLKAPDQQPMPQPERFHELPAVSPHEIERSAEALTQAQLARRLGVSAGMISRRKLSPDLPEWTKTRDPDGVGWAYLAQAQRFLPVK